MNVLMLVFETPIASVAATLRTALSTLPSTGVTCRRMSGPSLWFWALSPHAPSTSSTKQDAETDQVAQWRQPSSAAYGMHPILLRKKSRADGDAFAAQDSGLAFGHGLRTKRKGCCLAACDRCWQPGASR